MSAYNDNAVMKSLNNYLLKQMSTNRNKESSDTFRKQMYGIGSGLGMYGKFQKKGDMMNFGQDVMTSFNPLGNTSLEKMPAILQSTGGYRWNNKAKTSAEKLANEATLDKIRYLGGGDSSASKIPIAEGLMGYLKQGMNPTPRASEASRVGKLALQTDFGKEGEGLRLKEQNRQLNMYTALKGNPTLQILTVLAMAGAGANKKGTTFNRINKGGKVWKS